ncbi:MAG: peptidylprolyl isomerase [Chloroflexaceae bacterium]|nr:peptidylprolyl isomerase [Chloroflexaceae bacterium]NJO07475.1 peptidylprolyl isomerase [Chloroflexaceae bacterium]
MQKVLSRWAALTALVLALLLAGCSGQAAQTAEEAEPASPMIFRVGDAVVTQADYEARLEEAVGPILVQLLAQGQTPEQITELADQQNVRQSVLDEMIQQELLLRVAREEGIGVDTEAVDAEIEQRQQFLESVPDSTTTEGAPAAEGTPDAEGATSGLSEEELADLREQVTNEQLVLQVVANNTTADMFNSKHILVEDEATANEVLERLEDGDDFAELAAEYSQDPGSAETGGSYGWVTRGSFVPEYEEAAFTTELNEPVIVQSQFGYHVIVVEDREEGRPYEDIEQLRNSSTSQQDFETSFLPWYEELRAQAEEEGLLEIDEEFDPASVPLPFPEGTELAPASDDATDGDAVPAEPEPESTPEE